MRGRACGSVRVSFFSSQVWRRGIVVYLECLENFASLEGCFRLGEDGCHAGGSDDEGEDGVGELHFDCGECEVEI